MSIDVYAVDISKNMRRHRKEVFNFIKLHMDDDNIIMLFDDCLYALGDFDFNDQNQVSFLRPCNYYDCISELIYILHSQYKDKEINVEILSSGVDNFSEFHTLETFERYIEHMTHYHPISVSHRSTIGMPELSTIPEEPYAESSVLGQLMDAITDYLKITP